MKALILNGGIAVILFVGALAGSLAATGRLNPAGVANLPLLGALFPEPVAPADDAHDPAAAPAPAGEVQDAAGHKQGTGTAEAGHAQGPGSGDSDAPVQKKTGRSVFAVETKAGDGHGDGGGGHGDAGGGHGGGAKPTAAGSSGSKSAASGSGSAAKGEHPAERDFKELAQDLAEDRRSKYAPGGYFTFTGLPAGVTAEQINEAWQRVQGVQADLQRRESQLELRERAVRELADDVGKRQAELGRERLRLEDLQRQLDDRIEQFKQQVKVVRTDEVAGLKRNAQFYASIEPSKAAELVRELWRNDRGQDEVLKMLEVMDKEAGNKILQLLPNELVREVLQRRLKVVKEPAAAGDRAR